QEGGPACTRPRVLANAATRKPPRSCERGYEEAPAFLRTRLRRSPRVLANAATRKPPRSCERGYEEAPAFLRTRLPRPTGYALFFFPSSDPGLYDGGSAG